jgi:hypothetical protein
MKLEGQVQWLMPVIPAMRKAEMGVLRFKTSLGKKLDLHFNQ